MISTLFLKDLRERRKCWEKNHKVDTVWTWFFCILKMIATKLLADKQVKCKNRDLRDREIKEGRKSEWVLTRWFWTATRKQTRWKRWRRRPDTASAGLWRHWRRMELRQVICIEESYICIRWEWRGRRLPPRRDLRCGQLMPTCQENAMWYTERQSRRMRRDV